MQTASDPYLLFHIINNAHTPAGDLFFGVVSGLGDGLVVALLCSMLMLFRLRLGLAALVAYLLSGLITQVIKHMFDMPRPPALLEHVHLLGSTLTSHSFPSGHATSDGVMLLVAFLLWPVKSWRSWSVGTLFLLAAVGRVYGGVHFPTDVMAGLSIGVVTMWILWRWSGSWPVESWLQSQWAWKIPGLIVAVEAAVLGLGYHMQPSTAQPLAVVLPVAALMVLMHVWKEQPSHEQ